MDNYIAHFNLYFYASYNKLKTNKGLFYEHAKN